MSEQDNTERFSFEVSVKAPLSIDKRALPEMAQRVVIWGGDKVSLFRARMRRNPENRSEIQVKFPDDVFDLSSDQERRTYFQFQAREFSAPNAKTGGVVCSPGGMGLHEKQNKKDGSLFQNMDHLTTVKAVGNRDDKFWQIRTMNFKEGSKNGSQITVVEEFWEVNMPSYLATYFSLKMIKDSMPSMEEVTKHIETKVDQLPTEVPVDGSEEPVNLQERMRWLIPALAASLLKALGAELSYLDVAPEREEEEDSTDTTTSETAPETTPETDKETTEEIPEAEVVGEGDDDEEKKATG